MARITIDATALIALTKPNDAHHKWAVDFFKETVDDELYISALTFAEVLVYPVRDKTAKKFLELINVLGLQVLPISDSDVLGLADVRVKSGLRMPDAVVLHMAIRSGTQLATADFNLAKTAKKSNLVVHQPR